jgi:hypothetical protein
MLGTDISNLHSPHHFSVSQSSKCPFLRYNPTTEQLILSAVWADDFGVGISRNTDHKLFFEQLNSFFPIKVSPMTFLDDDDEDEGGDKDEDEGDGG